MKRLFSIKNIKTGQRRPFLWNGHKVWHFESKQDAKIARDWMNKPLTAKKKPPLFCVTRGPDNART